MFDGRPLSVCLSVCPVYDSKSRMEGLSELKIGTKEAHGTDDSWPYLQMKMSKVKVIVSRRQSDACLSIT